MDEDNAVAEDDVVNDDATVEEEAETSNNDEWLFNGVNISVLFRQYQVCCSILGSEGRFPPSRKLLHLFSTCLS